MSTDIKHNFEKSIIHYIDIGLAVINSLIIIFPLIIFHENIFISIIGILLSGVLIVKTIYTFIKNNPLYIYYCYGILICSLFFLIPSLWITPLFGILIPPEICYIYNLYKVKGQPSVVSQVAKVKFLRRAGGRGFNIRNLNQTWDNINPELELIRRKHRETLEKQYKSKKILAYSLFLSLSLFVIFILYTLSFVPKQY